MLWYAYCYRCCCCCGSLHPRPLLPGVQRGPSATTTARASARIDGNWCVKCASFPARVPENHPAADRRPSMNGRIRACFSSLAGKDEKIMMFCCICCCYCSVSLVCTGSVGLLDCFCCRLCHCAHFRCCLLLCFLFCRRGFAEAEGIGCLPLGVRFAYGTQFPIFFGTNCLFSYGTV